MRTNSARALFTIHGDITGTQPHATQTLQLLLLPQDMTQTRLFFTVHHKLLQNPSLNWLRINALKDIAISLLCPACLHMHY